MTTLQKKDSKISMIRLIATVMIVTCHMMQYCDFVLAVWFNVGVQIFLCMSGYLYGYKINTDVNDIDFYKRTIPKILIDYYIVIVGAIIIQLVLFPDEISMFKIAGALITFGRLSGGAHLWYIPYVIASYLMVPLLARFMDYYKGNNKKLVVATLFAMAFVLLMSVSFVRYFEGAWIICFIIGFFFGFCEKNTKVTLIKNIRTIIYIVCILLNVVQIYVSYFSDLNFEGFIENIYIIYCNFAHVSLGCSIFLLLRQLPFELNNSRFNAEINKVLALSDKYSYDIYLVHHFFILGPASLMALTGFLPANIVIIIVITLVCAVVVNKLSGLIKSAFNRNNK